jgi:hypothetical protein
MWALSWLYALLACVIFVGLVLWLSFGYVPNKVRKAQFPFPPPGGAECFGQRWINSFVQLQEIEWGDARTALIFHQVRLSV